ncbi:hypothetical protein EXIGLDRAFT_831652 [Exidia glandulosa HHB12029]|uniref:CBM6 domain-containing protein n=1 Tax=Exidia glandulosa HHB12029 TaxID=1314781 RepID=A0A165MIQ4_EXIGL|nr:hypothetical protein EXIGLDRAFT_831652 [Exidia glandulosa HHB12029]
MSFLLIVCTGSALTKLVNVTIDDTNGDERTGVLPTYTVDPASQRDGWHPSDKGKPCSVCNANVDGSRTHDQTWHDGTAWAGERPANVTLSFSGITIYVYAILRNTGPERPTRLTFYLDDMLADTYVHEQDASLGAFQYDQLVFSTKTNLRHGQHTLVVSNTQTSKQDSTFLFDYAVYTHDDAAEGSGVTSTEGSDPTSSTIRQTVDPSNVAVPVNVDHHSASSKTGVIVGAALGGAAFLVLLALGIVLLWNRRRGGGRAMATVTTPTPTPVRFDYSSSQFVVSPANSGRAKQFGSAEARMRLANPPPYEHEFPTWDSSTSYPTSSQTGNSVIGVNMSSALGERR